MSLKFWMNTALMGAVPGARAYIRSLARHRNPNYRHERDRNQVRLKHNGESGWQTEMAEGIKKRDYASYDEYVEHQKTKFDEIIQIHGGFSRKTLVKYRLQFYYAFRDLPRLLPKDARILCAGARQGTEVEVLRDLGFKNSWGIDLNPGPENPFVVPGDFMKLDEKDGALDAIYCNAVDHAFDLHKFFAEHARALKPTGYAVYDIAIQEGGAFEAVHWERDSDVFRVLLQYFNNLTRVTVDPSGRWKTVYLTEPRPRRA